ncbi:N-succinylarginine dihydrolase [Caulobacter segnis]|uniref:N-succinylarginine dihydrolase n=1 Tax=Caulobacter segnis TaxID=88688 RepID=UPI002410B467|nr:N-succinylarginine dihydrolase [Caulobacter segnis]MDG2523195.1 N-succinylarginine dihydrolase [Caulobacter segnis]
MRVSEINFDGLVGPTHNYAGLSLGNVASQGNAGETSKPRAAALEGLSKMGQLMALGLEQGFLPPHHRPAVGPLRALGFAGTDAQILAQAAAEDPALLRNASSASAMWAANAATIIAAPDSGDGRTHLAVANLSTMLHRSFEHEETYRNLRAIFHDETHFAVHRALPGGAHFSDEGAANHMRLAADHSARGVNVFVHGGEARGGRYPERQQKRASEAVARLGGLKAGDPMFVRQSLTAVEAGAFHNDVVAVANERVLLAHPDAFDDKGLFFDVLSARLPQLVIAEVDVSLEAAVRSYLFNSQLVTLPDGDMALILPAEAEAENTVWAAVQKLIDGPSPIRRAVVVDVRESMRNGGGPACLRLRVAVPDAARAGLDQRFLLNERRIEALSVLVERTWPEAVAPSDLLLPDLWRDAAAAMDGLRATIQGF